MNISHWVGLFLMMLSANALAEGGCPPGQLPAQSNGSIASCVPVPQGYYQQSDSPQAKPSGKWIKTWGAIAMGSIRLERNYGVSTGKLSKAEAEQDAMARCSKHGENNCQIGLAYFNQCAAVGEPQIDGKPDLMGTVNFNGAESVEKAEALAQVACQKSNPNNPCKIVYKACTKQLFEEF
ncbi:DUF4189 domain-containing protein [Xanthomonas sacchari]|uniref:DUF4189 domain-containing protein n=1 Tax=Xanthomonas sacchari TaxID=56458 RepID=UPI0022560A30|nr:DUF4189 domain-containing protein [Xanthomonas sacchari]